VSISRPLARRACRGRRNMVMKRISIAVCLLVAACGGQSEPEEEPASFKDMNFEQRYVFMEDVVMPQMKSLFVAFDAKFQGMDCKTCHGNGALNGSYAMPSAEITVLPTEEDFPKRMEEDPEFAKGAQFMLDQVWPQMATLLEVPKYDPETHTGFSCANCHTVEGMAL
jgi:hypothetical protein